jgi:cytochrome P450
MATRYQDIRSLLSDARLSSDTSAEGFPQSSAAVVAQRGGQKSFIRMDPPRHDQHRLMLTADFMVRHVREMRPFIDALVDRCFDQMDRSAKPVDLVRALAQPVPANVIARLLDLSDEGSAFFQERVDVWMRHDSPAEAAARASADAMNYFDQLIDERRDRPGPDLVSRLVRNHMLTGDLTRTELLHMLHLLVVGGYDTTANMISLGTLALLQRRDQFEALSGQPELVPAAVEELLRYLSVAHHVGFRLAARDIEIAGKCIHAGDGVIAPIMAANRDPEVFPDPDRLDIRRDARGHLAFGYGVHQCLGQALARVELQAVFAKLPRRFPTLRTAVGFDQLHFKSSLIYGVDELPVTW